MPESFLHLKPQEQSLILWQQAILVELLLKSVFALRQLGPSIRQANLLLVDLLGQWPRAVIHFFKESQQLTFHPRFNEFVMGQERARFDVRYPCPIRQIGGPDVRSGIHPPDDLGVQDVGNEFAIEVRAGFVQKPLQHGRIDSYGVVVASEEFQRLQMLCAGLEQLHVVAAGVGDCGANARAGFNHLAQQVLEQLFVERAGDETHCSRSFCYCIVIEHGRSVCERAAQRMRHLHHLSGVARWFANLGHVRSSAP